MKVIYVFVDLETGEKTQEEEFFAVKELANKIAEVQHYNYIHEGKQRCYLLFE